MTVRVDSCHQCHTEDHPQWHCTPAYTHNFPHHSDTQEPDTSKSKIGRGHTLDIAPPSEATSLQRHALSSDFMVLPARPRVYSRME